MAEKLTKKELENSVILIRAVIKLSNSLMNLDNLDDGECSFFTRKMKMDFLNYGEWLENHVKQMVDAYMEENEHLVVELITWFTEIESHFQMDDFHDKELMLFIAKNQSAVNDLRSLVKYREFTLYVAQIISRFEKICSKGYMKKFEFITFKHGSFNKVVDQMDALGEKMVSSS